MSTDRDRRLARRISAWFHENARDLPWRTVPREPYHALVSELMLQQTQVARVVERFTEFIERFPTIEHLARADEQDVLTLWSGLGYYRRAKLLHRAAQAVVEDHGGALPHDTTQLESLPGIGRYTAGAIASIAMNERAPIVDGNVARVILRLDGIESTAHDARTYLWQRAKELVDASDDPAAFNEGMMELGAVVCTPANPSCDRCPVSRSCCAKRDGTVDRIPSPKKTATRKTLHIAMAVIEDERGRLLVERRDDRGLWAGLWQGPSIESLTKKPTKPALANAVGLTQLKISDALSHETSHRSVRFVSYRGRADSAFEPAQGVFRTRAQIAKLPLSSPHRALLLGTDAPSPNKD